MSDLTAGLIGAHIQATRLPKALGIMCAQAGVGLSFELVDTAERPDFRFAETVDGLIAKGWSGVTVTHPHKIEAADYAGRAMRAEAAHLGACNTLVFGPPLAGHNTDYSGFLSAWRHGMGDTAPGRVAMAGAGGVAHALAPALARLGAERIDIWDLDADRARALAAEVGGVARAVDIGASAEVIREADGLVNATALGMGGDGRSAFAGDLLGGQKWAFDAVYTPTDTVFLSAAARAGIETLSGFDLFRHMAMNSFTAYTGIEVDAAQMLPQLAGLRPE